MSYLDVISGEAKGIGAVLLRGVLRVLSWLYGAVVWLRNVGYDKDWLRSYELDVPVVCVGNITAGGTGKTPMVVWVCRMLQEQGMQVCVLTRGYKGETAGGSDEVRLLRGSLRDVGVVVDADRVRGGRTAIEKYGAEVLVMDDGFQHRRLRRRLDIVMIDCLAPFGYGYVLPRGLLRESLAGLRRAGAVVLSRCDMVDPEGLGALKQQVRRIVGEDMSVACSRHEVVGMYNIDGSEYGLPELVERKVVAVCGIGNPGAFVRTLEDLGAIVVGQRFFADHVEYSEGMVRELKALWEKSGADWVVTTEKDWVKLRQVSVIHEFKELCWVRVAMRFCEGEEEIATELRCQIAHGG